MNFLYSIRTKSLLFGGLFILTAAAGAEELNGVVDFGKRITIEAWMFGEVEHINGSVGEMIAKDQVIIKLNSSRIEAATKILAIRVNRIEMNLERLKAKFERQQELYDRGSLSLLAFEEIQHEVSLAKSKSEEARTKLGLAQSRADRMEIKSPFDAIVLENNTHVGAMLRPFRAEEPLMTLAKQGDYVVRVLVPHNIRIGMQAEEPATVVVNGQHYEAQTGFHSFDPHVQENGTFYRVDFRFNDNSKLILPGTPAVVQLTH